MRKKAILAIGLILSVSLLFGQSNLEGTISSDGEKLGYGTVQLFGINLSEGQVADQDGNFSFSSLEPGAYMIRVRQLGYRVFEDSLHISKNSRTQTLNIELMEDRLNLENVVVSATRYDLDRQKAPVIVNLIDQRLLRANQSLSISDALSFQSGVRVESNCQNCGFTQVRLNGLDGSYSQILINSRPVFSALTSVYGLEQIPSNIVDQIEIVRSGGSALFGSNAIAGTINIITREPVANSWQVASNHALIAGEAQDHSLNFNTSLIDNELQKGITLYGMLRDRQAWDANGDGFTELVEIESRSFGAKGFFNLTERTDITLDASTIAEYRRGGDRLELEPHLTDITEQLEHGTIFYGINVNHNSRDGKGKLNAYISGQNSARDSYYGGLGGSRTPEDSAVALSAYGKTSDFSLVSGVRQTYNFSAEHITTGGVEHQYNTVTDKIPGYRRSIDQTVQTYAAFVQHEWKPFPALTALLGGRYDYTIVEGDYRLGDLQRSSNQNFGVLSPRVTLLYTITPAIQLRGGYARGFRAPQAFNEDLHISSAGGEQKFVLLSDELEKETSDALTASVNFTQNYGYSQFNFLVEGFHTRLHNPFTLVNTGNVLSQNAILEEVRNARGAVVTGINFEANYVPNSYFLFQLGGTYQNTRYLEEQVLFESEQPTENRPNVIIESFIRNPDLYGYLVGNWSPTKKLSIDLTGTYTGRMIVPRIVDESGYLELRQSKAFMDMNIKLTREIKINKHLELNVMGGIQNMLDSFQNDFDTGADRDSDYVYGPMRPRTFFIGLKIRN